MSRKDKKIGIKEMDGNIKLLAHFGGKKIVYPKAKGITIDYWIHLAVVIKNDKAKIYVNGKKV